RAVTRARDFRIVMFNASYAENGQQISRHGGLPVWYGQGVNRSPLFCPFSALFATNPPGSGEFATCAVAPGWGTGGMRAILGCCFRNRNGFAGPVGSGDSPR